MRETLAVLKTYPFIHRLRPDAFPGAAGAGLCSGRGGGAYPSYNLHTLPECCRAMGALWAGQGACLHVMRAERVWPPWELEKKKVSYGGRPLFTAFFPLHSRRCTAGSAVRVAGSFLLEPGLSVSCCRQRFRSVWWMAAAGAGAAYCRPTVRVSVCYSSRMKFCVF